jgi:hypothetical protein
MKFDDAYSAVPDDGIPDHLMDAERPKVSFAKDPAKRTTPR